MELTAGERTEIQGYLQTSTSANLMMLPLKMEAVRIRTQRSGWGWGVVSKHITKHFQPTPKSSGQGVEKKKNQKRKIFLPAGGWAWDGGLRRPLLTRSPPSPHHPTRRFGLDFFFFFSSTSSSPLGGFQRLSKGDSTSEERKGEREIKTKQTNPSLVQNYLTASIGPASVRKLTNLA